MDPSSDPQAVQIYVTLAELVDGIRRPRIRGNSMQRPRTVSCDLSIIILDRRLLRCFEYLFPLQHALADRHTGLSRQIILGMHRKVSSRIFVKVAQRIGSRKSKVANINLKSDQLGVR